MGVPMRRYSAYEDFYDLVLLQLEMFCRSNLRFPSRYAFYIVVSLSACDQKDFFGERIPPFDQ